jgi:hypothetical protein
MWFALARIYFRKATGLEKFLKGALANNSYCSLINLFTFTSLIFSTGWAVFGWWLTRRKVILIWGMITPALFLAFFRMLTYLSLNEYDWQ